MPSLEQVTLIVLLSITAAVLLAVCVWGVQRCCCSAPRLIRSVVEPIDPDVRLSDLGLWRETNAPRLQPVRAARLARKRLGVREVFDGSGRGKKKKEEVKGGLLSRWRVGVFDRSSVAEEVKGGGKVLRLTGPAVRSFQATAPLSTAPLAKGHHYYFEVTAHRLHDTGVPVDLAVGFATRPHPGSHLVGTCDVSIALHSFTGRLHCSDGSGSGKWLRSALAEGDVIGAGYVLPAKGEGEGAVEMYFTHNGSVLGWVELKAGYQAVYKSAGRGGGGRSAGAGDEGAGSDADESVGDAVHVPALLQPYLACSGSRLSSSHMPVLVQGGGYPTCSVFGSADFSVNLGSRSGPQGGSGGRGSFVWAVPAPPAPTPRPQLEEVVVTEEQKWDGEVARIIHGYAEQAEPFVIPKEIDTLPPRPATPPLQQPSSRSSSGSLSPELAWAEAGAQDDLAWLDAPDEEAKVGPAQSQVKAKVRGGEAKGENDGEDEGSTNGRGGRVRARPRWLGADSFTAQLNTPLTSPDQQQQQQRPQPSSAARRYAVASFDSSSSDEAGW